MTFSLITLNGYCVHSYDITVSVTASLISFNAETAPRRIFSDENIRGETSTGTQGAPTDGLDVQSVSQRIQIILYSVCVWCGQTEMPPGHSGVWTRIIRHNIFRILYTSEEKNKN